MRGPLDAITMATGIREQGHSGTKKVEAPMSAVGAVDASPLLGWRRTRAGDEAMRRSSMRPDPTRRFGAVRKPAVRRRADLGDLAHAESELARLAMLLALAIVGIMRVFPRLLELAAAAGT
jgi:hypothetical protein